MQGNIPLLSIPVFQPETDVKQQTAFQNTFFICFIWEYKVWHFIWIICQALFSQKKKKKKKKKKNILYISSATILNEL